MFAMYHLQQEISAQLKHQGTHSEGTSQANTANYEGLPLPSLALTEARGTVAAPKGISQERQPLNH